MKCMNVKGLEAYQVKQILKKLEETLRNNYWSEMREFGREIREVSREIERNEFWIAQGALNSVPKNLDK